MKEGEHTCCRVNHGADIAWQQARVEATKVSANFIVGFSCNWNGNLCMRILVMHGNFEERAVGVQL